MRREFQFLIGILKTKISIAEQVRHEKGFNSL